MNSRGIALLAGLFLLAALSLLALTTATGTILQRNMATNFQENSLALQMLPSQPIMQRPG